MCITLFRAYGLISIALLFSLDQLSKWAVLNSISVSEPITLTSFFNLVLTFNRGVSFGFFPAGSIYGKLVLIFLALCLSVWLLVCLYRSVSKLESTAYGLIIGGALGNVVDRMRFGGVVDFLDFHIAGYHWPAFNIADSGIVLGVILIFLQQAWHGGKNNN